MNSIFDKKPSQWGLRGDSYLWIDIKKYFNSIKMPTNEKDFEIIFEQIFKELTGEKLSCNKNIFLEKYNKGGMSSGMVSASFWKDNALPLLIERFKKIYK